jgi:hypothetical protein
MEPVAHDSFRRLPRPGDIRLRLPQGHEATLRIRDNCRQGLIHFVRN